MTDTPPPSIPNSGAAPHGARLPGSAPLVYLCGRASGPGLRSRLTDLLESHGFETTTDNEKAWHSALSGAAVVIFDITARFTVIGRVRATLEDPDEINDLLQAVGRERKSDPGIMSLQLVTGGSERTRPDVDDGHLLQRVHGALTESGENSGAESE